MLFIHFVGPLMFELWELSHSGEEFGVCEVILQKSLLLLHMSFIEESVQQHMCCSRGTVSLEFISKLVSV